MASAIYEVDEEALEKEREKGANGNLYYKVNFLYPWMLYYAVALTSIIDPLYTKEDFEQELYEYNEIKCKRDRAIVQQFLAEIMKCLASAIGTEKTLRIMELMEMVCQEPNITDVYGVCICNYYCDVNKKSKVLKKNMLTAIAYTMIGMEFLWEEDSVVDTKKYKSDFKKAKDCLFKETGKPFPEEDDVIKELKKIMKGNNGYTESEEDQVANLYGEVDWNNLKW